MSTSESQRGLCAGTSATLRAGLRLGVIAALSCAVAAGCKREERGGGEPAGSASGGSAGVGATGGAKQGGAEKGGAAAKKGAEPSYELTVKPPPQKAVGAKVAAEVKLVPKGPYKVNMEYPLRLEVEGPKSSKPGKLVMGSKDAAEMSKKKVLLEPTFELTSAGEHRFRAELRFSVCTKKQCELKTEKLTWVATAK